MSKRIIILFLVLCLPLCLNAKGPSKAKIFGIAGFTSSLFAIGSDILAEHYNDRYEEATLEKDMSHYKNLAEVYERIRDMSLLLAVASFTISTIVWIGEKKSVVSLELDYKKEKLRVGLRKDF
jgi:hypothetical protein